MLDRPFRFVHASDFHLEQPLTGVAEVPAHLRELFLDASYAAAQRVFDAVGMEDADFLLLSGDLADLLQAGPRAMHFLAQQFTRLAEQGISVYWAGGKVDPPEAWPAAISLPATVHMFPRGQAAEWVHEQDGMPVARIVGLSREKQQNLRPKDFAADPSGLYTIAVAHGVGDPAVLQGRGIHYWALGGRHERNTPLSGAQTIHYPGCPQGRRPQEQGVHGCTLVQVDGQRQARTSLIPTEGVRWLSECIAIDEATTRDDLETRFRERLHALTESAAAVPMLISWTVSGKGPLASQMRQGKHVAELLDWLRADFGRGQPIVWSLSLDVELKNAIPLDWYDQETIRGDFLRAVRQLQMNPEEAIDLDEYVAESHRAGSLAASVALGDKAARERVLREAALLGVDLLSGEEAQS